MARSKTIQIYLPNGNPQGMKIVDLSNRTIRALLVPRANLKEAQNRSELNQPALYVICDREGSQAYIGECENFFSRIKNHEQKKRFWEVAIVFVAIGKSLDKAEVKFLESLAIEAAKAAQRMEIQNTIMPTRNTLQESKVNDMEEFFDDLRLLIATLGYPVFDKVTLDTADEDQVWYCKTRQTRATAVYDGNGFTMLKGSLIDGTDRPSFPRLYPAATAERHKIFAEKARLADKEKNIYELTENVTFTSANQAGAFCVGGHMNAWITWKNKDGRTMDEVMRQSQF